MGKFCKILHSAEIYVPLDVDLHRLISEFPSPRLWGSLILKTGYLHIWLPSPNLARGTIQLPAQYQQKKYVRFWTTPPPVEIKEVWPAKREIRISPLFSLYFPNTTFFPLLSSNPCISIRSDSFFLQNILLKGCMHFSSLLCVLRGLELYFYLISRPVKHF